MPPQSGRGRPRRVPMDKEDTPTSHTPLSQGDPQFPTKFLVPPMPQVEFFPSMTLEAFHAFTNYWYEIGRAHV